MQRTLMAGIKCCPAAEPVPQGRLLCLTGVGVSQYPPVSYSRPDLVLQMNAHPLNSHSFPAGIWLKQH